MVLQPMYHRSLGFSLELSVTIFCLGGTMIQGDTQKYYGCVLWILISQEW
nr:hypothetical protein Iba_chr03aCG2050 [Ipomoea batatas]